MIDSFRLFIITFFSGIALEGQAKIIYMATTGNDGNPGTVEQPLASFKKAYSLLNPGDTIYIRGGIYKITPEQVMNDTDPIYTDVFYLDKEGTPEKPLAIMGFPRERVIFDLKEIRPAKRVTAFCVKGDFHHFKNFEVIHTQVTQAGHTQSECFRNDGGNFNIYEGLKMHDSMGVGFYLTAGGHNLIVNCDVYNIDDKVSEAGRNENTDGFGYHPRHVSDTCNVFRGCRTWNCGDDGFDLINAMAPVTIEHCWAITNGYKADGSRSGGNGNGFKAGGYGMGIIKKIPDTIPQHIIRHCLSYGNLAHGFYANHHLGGILFLNNTAYGNAQNYDMTNRASASKAADVPGYGHILKNNVSFKPRYTNGTITNVNPTACVISNNTFLSDYQVRAQDFKSLDTRALTNDRGKDGNLPHTDFMVPKEGHFLFQHQMGYTF